RPSDRGGAQAHQAPRRVSSLRRWWLIDQRGGGGQGVQALAGIGLAGDFTSPIRPGGDSRQRFLRLRQLGARDGKLVPGVLMGLEEDRVVTTLLRGLVILIRRGQRPFK